jgi:heat shock protein HslJ
VATLAWPAFASEQAFPFARELMLDVAPMRGSKRVPIIEIADDGAAVIQLWCASTSGQASIDKDSITITAGQVPPAQCEPERQTRDDDLLAALAQVPLPGSRREIQDRVRAGRSFPALFCT